MADEVIEATLAQFREVNLYQIPPRSGAGGHKSGTFCKHAACYRARHPPLQDSHPHTPRHDKGATAIVRYG